MKVLLRVISACLLLLVAGFIPAEGTLKLMMYLAAYIIAGYDVLLEAVEGIREREIFDENFLMSIASTGALILGEYSEACAVMILYQIGELFQDYASERSRKTIVELMDIRPDYANVEREGRVERVNPELVDKGSIIIIRPGEKIPIDGTIIEGNSSIDTKALTGESIPRDVRAGDEVMSGCVNLSGLLRVRTACEFHEGTVSKILELVENSSSRKSKAERFITRFARVYTPVVCLCALCVAVIPPVMAGSSWEVWVYRALTFLVISCPCALVIGVPLTFFAGIGGAGRRGILVKGANYLEVLARSSCVVFDKTGTLTQGVFEVSAVHPDIMNESELLHLAAHVERYSSHPAADSLRRAYPNENDACTVEEAEELAGYGVRAKVNGHIVCAGSSRLMDSIGARWHPCEKSGTIIHISIDGTYAGHVVISDVIKPSSREAVSSLRREGIKRIIMLTGDTKASADEAAGLCGITEVFSELLPSGKVSRVEELMKEGECVVFVGDGINDAPVLAEADVGAAMGAIGSDAAVESADIVLMNDDPLKIPEAIRISLDTMKIVKENIYFPLAVKIICLVLGALGLAGMRAAVFADTGVMILAVLNAMGALFTNNFKLGEKLLHEIRF